MAATVGHLGCNALKEVVGWLWDVIYIGIQRVLYQAISNSNTLPQ
jgi:hypothetical protein